MIPYNPNLLNFTNLYPDIPYNPIQAYDNMDETNIRNTINERLSLINRVENRLNKSLLNLTISNPKYLNEFFARYSGPDFYKKFQYPTLNQHSFTSWFNSEAVHPDVDSNYLVFNVNEAGIMEESDFIILLFDYQGKLIKPYNYKIRNLNGGLTIYVRKYDLYNSGEIVSYHSAEENSNDHTLKILCIRKKFTNSSLRYVSKTNTSGTASSIHFDLTNNQANSISPVVDKNYYTFFKKTPSDNYFRQVIRDNTDTIISDENLLSFNIDESSLNNTQYLFLNTLDYSELDIIYTCNSGVNVDYVSDNSNIDTVLLQSINTTELKVIPLINGLFFPIAFKSVLDTMLWVNGIKLTPGVDYFIDFNDELNSKPPSIVLCENKSFPLGSNNHIKLILNQPFHPKNLCAYFDKIEDHGIVDFGRDIVSYSAKNSSICFSNGRFVSPEDIEVLSNNIIAVKNIVTSRRFEYNFSYLVNNDINYIIDYFNDFESDLDKYLRYSNNIQLTINEYIDYNNLNTISSTFSNTVACDCASINFSRFVNIEVDSSNTYSSNYALYINETRNYKSFVLNCNNDSNYMNSVVFDCRNIEDQTEDCLLVFDCNTGLTVI